MVVLFGGATLGMTAQELPPDLQAGVDLSEEGANDRLLEMMLDYRAVLEAELAELNEQRAHLQDRLDNLERSIRAHKAWAWILIPLGLAAAGTGGYFFMAAEEAYGSYQNAATSGTAAPPRDQAALYDILGPAIGGGGLVLAGTGIISALTTPKRGELEGRHRVLLDKITRLEEHLQ